MRVLLAGASGAIGTPLTRQLLAAGHDVLGLTRSPANAERLRRAGAEPVVADALDRAGLLAAVRDVRADAVVHQLTNLGAKNPLAAARATNAVRTVGTANLLAAARAVGATRFLTQSIILAYGYRDHGPHVLTEDDPLAVAPRGYLGRILGALLSNEEQVLTATDVEGIALRYGLFYGDDSVTRAMVRLVGRRRLPVPRSGGGFISPIHLDDAAAATVAALDRGRGGQAYNVVDDEPVRWADFLDTVAAELGVPRPRRVPDWLPRAIPYAGKVLDSSLRVANAKARRELGWAPAVPTYREGVRLIVHPAPTPRGG
jgi:nucleoside-diphosphate-sugar epimerase